MTETAFCPTHRITLRSGEVEEVMLVDGAAYTREEWDSETQADYERDEAGAWTFQGQPFACSISEIKDDSVVTYDPTAEQIAALEAEATQHGDLLMAAICRVAAGRDHAEIPLDGDDRRRVDATTTDDALAEVARCLREAAAQSDD